MKKLIYFLSFVFISLLILSGCTSKKETVKYTIISTSFPGYDFARAITKDSKDFEVKMLLKPGAEMHSYEPTPQDIINISNADIFIYVGGDSDNWIEDVLKDINTDKTKIIKLMDLVDVVEEEHVEGMEEHEEEEEEVEYDEHVWTSPINAITIINKLKEEIIKVDNDNKSLYEDNSNNYTNELSNIDNEIRSLVKNAKRKEIIFGDRFPIRYFVEEYGLSYYAAFPGCSEQTEASAKTITFLINKVKKDNIPVIFHIELSNGNIAKTIAEETGTKVLEFKTAHNISQDDFDAGITYVDIMKSNIEVLKEAIN
jgi:zinc transport system substrate-binding protein